MAAEESNIKPVFANEDLSAKFKKQSLARYDFSYANLCQARMQGLDFLARANLQGVQMVRTNLVGADLRNCKVYGLSAWDLKLDQRHVEQQLIVRYRPAYGRRLNRDDEEVQVEGLDLAAFMYLTLNNRNISRIIDAAGRKWVLLLGRFTHRKSVLKAVAEALKQRQLTPIIFDFPPPHGEASGPGEGRRWLRK